MLTKLPGVALVALITIMTAFTVAGLIPVAYIVCTNNS